MAKSKVFRNLKGKASGYGSIPAEAAGPYTVAASATWYFAGVPCAGARMVVFTVRGTGSGTSASQTVVMGNHENGSDAVNAGTSEVTLRGDGNLSISAGNGLRVALTPAQGLLHHGFAFFGIVNDANQKTSVSVDAEVWYEGDAVDDRNSFGQPSVEAATY